MAEIPEKKVYGLRLYKKDHLDLMTILENGVAANILMEALVQYVRPRSVEAKLDVIHKAIDEISNTSSLESRLDEIQAAIDSLRKELVGRSISERTDTNAFGSSSKSAAINNSALPRDLINQDLSTDPFQLVKKESENDVTASIFSIIGHDLS